MKTTIDIADSLLERARTIANSEGTTLRALIELGLHRVVMERESAAPFELRDASFDGKGLQPALRDAAWEKIRDLAYGESV